MCQRIPEPGLPDVSRLPSKSQAFYEAEGKCAATEHVGTLSAESFLILVGSNWIQMHLRVKRRKENVCLVSLVWLNQTNLRDGIGQTD
jgi:hypothetical protein